MKKLALGVVILVLVGASFWFRDEAAALLGRAAWLSDAAMRAQVFAAPSPGSHQYISAPVELGEVRQTVTATGTLHARVTVDVGTQLSGQIAKLFVDFNDAVKKGQPLAQLDQKSFEARRAEAQAATKMAEAMIEVQKAKVERARVDTLDARAKRSGLQARVDNARIRVETAESDLKRKETLRHRGVVSPTQFEEAEATLKSAAAALREAEAAAAAHEHAVAGADADLQRVQAELDNVLASLPQKQATLRLAEIDLERTTILSPVDGIVLGRDINEGQTVAASLSAPTLFSIAGDLEQMEISARVDESDIGKIRTGQAAVFTVDAYPGRRFRAVVKSIRKAPQVVQNVVTYTVVLATSNNELLLLPGMTATVRITVVNTGQVLKIPVAALRFSPRFAASSQARQAADVPGGRPARIWISEQDGQPKPTTVAVGVDDGSYIAVLSGPLREGGHVLVGETTEAASRRLFGIRIGF